MKEEQLRKSLEDLIARRRYLYDEYRPEAQEKRKNKGSRTSRENIDDLCDSGSFVEMGSLIVAGQRGRRSEEELIRQTPADGLIAGIANVNKDLFGVKASKCAVLSYDYTVLAGTQGGFNHKKTDRMIDMVNQLHIPVIFFVEGGGGRPGDVDFDLISNGGLDIMTFVEYARLSGVVPRIAIVSGYCFAGNAAIAGCSDIIIATKDANLGMGGPAMIEGGGLGVYHPEEIGSMDVQSKNGVIDILVKDEGEAVQVAKQCLSYFQGNKKQWEIHDQHKLRACIPEDRKFAYNIHKVIELLGDKDSVLELRAGFALNIVTAFMRIEGKPVGVIANSTRHLGGAIDGSASDKIARFMQLCDAFDLPVLSLCDTPGFMVGPDCEAGAMVRHASRVFVVGAALRVPVMTVVLRKAYGLGAMAMSGGSLHESVFTIAWPTGEFGAMGLEGAVKLGFKRELEEAEQVGQREQVYEELVEASYRKGKALAAAGMLEFDEVIDPKDTRRWICSVLDSPSRSRNKPTRTFIDTW